MTSISPDRLDLALLAADPILTWRRQTTLTMAKPSAAWLEETKSLENAARVRVRRILAALNGVDIEREAAQWTEVPGILPRALVKRLVDALCTDEVFAAVERQIGADAAAELMGAITAL